MRTLLIALMLSAASTAAVAQPLPSVQQQISGTRLDINVTGEVTRVPDVALISAGVVTRATTASAAIQQNASRMDRVLAALKKAGVAEKDVQTSSISLNPEYRYPQNQAPQLTGYTASNQVTVKFRDIAESGRILDALVGEGANQINGPNLTVDHPEQALDEARAKAIATGRARANLYARSLGMQVARIVSVSESGGYAVPPPAPPMMEMRAQAADTKIVPGEQQLQVLLSMVFELR